MKASQYVENLKKYIGVPYVWGGKTAKGLDCSGLVYIGLWDGGIEFVHGSSNQIKACKPISLEEATRTPGALLWREGHDAISLGNNQTIEAVTTPKNGVGVFVNSPQRFTHAGLIPGVDYKEEKVSKMVSPFEGTLTYGYLDYPDHIGMDIRPKRRWTYGNEVRACLPGKVVDICTTQKHGDKTKGIGNKLNYGYRTGNGVIVENEDGEYQLYNHTMPCVEVGDEVLAGQVIGHNDNSGNQTGAHLHFECLYYSKKYKEMRPYDPQRLFDKYGVKPGADFEDIIDPLNDGPVKPIVKPRPKPKPKKRYLMVRRGYVGKTVERVQEALRKQGYTKQIVDGKFGYQTEANVKDFQRRTHLVVDGIAGEKTQKRLGL